MRRSVRMQDLWEIRLLKGSMDRRDCCMHPAAFCEYTAVAFDNPGVECADAGDINDLWNDSSEAYITYIIGSDRVGFILV